MKKYLFGAFALLLSMGLQAKVDYKVIPLPDHIIMNDTQGSFTLTKGALVAYPAKDAQMLRNAKFAEEYFGLKAVVADKALSPAITLSLGLKNNNPEAYEISVEKGGIRISGASASGVFYGLQTLRKSIANETGEAIQLPCATISATPRFAYRGAMLDCARHFFTVDEVKEYIDVLALHGQNKFHWHLTDDQGWRFEVKALPKLAKKAGYRPCTVVGNNVEIVGRDGSATGIFDNVPRQGYYTQKQLRDIVQYAAERYITIIPEIDLPGHMVAALSVYPELGCTGGPYEVWKWWGISDDVLCAGNPKVLEFLKTVYGELCNVFPSELIHIGGDESPRTRWKECPKCQAKMKELGLQNEAQLQTYINVELEKFLKERGRRIIGWDETLEGGLSDDGIVMSWRGFEGGKKAAQMHHNVIMTPTQHCYIDYHQLKDPYRVPAVIYNYLPLSRVYAMEPIPAELTAEEAKHIIGCQCNLWVEHVASRDVLQYQLMPRIAAMAEVQWIQPEAKNFNHFIERLPALKALYSKLGYKFCSSWE